MHAASGAIAEFVVVIDDNICGAADSNSQPGVFPDGWDAASLFAGRG